jgi:tetratricopeptide (TPR) repeat protein
MRPPTATGTSSTSIKIVSTPPPGHTPRPSMAPPETLDVAGKIKRIEQLCQRAAFEEAWPVARALVEEAPNHAKHQGLLGYVALCRAADTVVPKDVIDAINVALRINEDEVIALYTKALAYKRMGKDRESLHYFKRTVAVEPGHIDAAREIRLFGLRQIDDKKTRR